MSIRERGQDLYWQWGGGGGSQWGKAMRRLPPGQDLYPVLNKKSSCLWSKRDSSSQVRKPNSWTCNLVEGLMFLGIILRVFRLEVSVNNVYITNQFQITFIGAGGGGWLWIARRKTLNTFVPITSKYSASVKSIYSEAEFMDGVCSTMNSASGQKMNQCKRRNYFLLW